ncbi:MAG TPA: hypothetical protein VHR45_16915 [Thermoanaerobaculia bacterium]|nr:hypothetical protein [Thermoanaerobaculia bacterium]
MWSDFRSKELGILAVLAAVAGSEIVLAAGQPIAGAPIETRPAAGVAAASAAAPAVPATAPAAAWERLKSLAGTWKGRSTKGWEETTSLRLIAAGSVLLETSQFADDPEGRNAMATVYYPDGGRLLLTHYCEAKNQPRLVATGFADGGMTLVFSFLDGGNLPSRDGGHMDKIEMHFVDADHFTSRWTWYQDGRAAWLEEARYERVR